MGVDAEMVVRLLHPLSDDELIDASYRLMEACDKSDDFFVSDDEAIARGEYRRALNRIGADEDSEYRSYGVAKPDGHWFWLSLWGRYYGPGYERGNLWRYIAIAEWLEHNYPGCAVFYGGDSGETLKPFTVAERSRLIAHWADKGGRPYYADPRWADGQREDLRPTCPLCQKKATQYGSGGTFASWTCDGCARHWVWIGKDVRAYPPSRDWDSFKAAQQQRDEEATSVGAVDPVGERVTGGPRA